MLKSGSAESHTTLELSLPSDIAPSQTLYLATARLTIDGVRYDWHLRNGSTIKTSLTSAADRASVEIQNVDTVFGVDALRLADSLYGAKVKLGRYWRDLRSSATFQRNLLTGLVASVEIDENVVRLGLVSDLYATINVGASEQVIRKCRWQVSGRFRGTECGYSGALLTCNGLYDSADGCEGRHGTPLKQAKFGGFAYIESASTVSGAAALPVPAYNQLLKSAASDGTVSATNKQQPFLALHEEGYNVANDDTNQQTRISPKFSVQAINVKFDYGATGDGSTYDGTAVDNAVSAALSQGRPLYFPTGTYLGVNLTGITYQLKIFGDGPERSILKASAGNTTVIEIDNASSHTIEISDLTVEGAGNTSGSSGHGIYVHDQSDGLYNFFLNNVWVKNCGGNGVYVEGQFTNKFKGVFVSNCGGNAFDISGGNTIELDSCYVDDVANNKIAYRIRAGQCVMLNCNGLDSLGSVSDWAVIGQSTGDGDAIDSYCELKLIGCNVESFKRYGVWAKVGSRVSASATFFTTSASGSNHVAIRTDFTNNQPGIVDSLCRFSEQGSGTWANSLPIHSNSDIPVLMLGRTDQTQYYADAASTARTLPILSATPISTAPYTYAPNFATDNLRFPTDNSGDIGASGANRPRDLFLARNLAVGGTTALSGAATQSASVAGFLGWTVTNSDSSGQAGFYGVNHSGKNVFLQVFQDGTGIAQMGSDHFPIYIKAAGTNRWYFDDLLFSPLQDNTSDIGAGSTRIKDGFFSGSLNLKERTAPSTPAENTVVLYAKDNGGTSALYFKDDTGTETQVGSGGGGAGTVSSGTANQLAYYASTGTTVSGLTSANSSVLVTNGSGVPSWATDLPTGTTIGGAAIYRAGGTDVAVADGGTGLSSGTSGGVLYFSASGTLASSGALTSNSLVLGGGAGSSPKVAAGLTTDGTSKLNLGVAGASVGAIAFANATSGTITLQPVTGALGTVTLLLPATSSTLATLTGAESLTNKKLGSLTSNGFVKTSSGDGTLSVDTNSYALASSVPSGANPTGTIGLTAVNGSATSFLRSDGAPALSQAIAPTWTALHTYSLGSTPSDAILLTATALATNNTRDSHALVFRGNTRSGVNHVPEWKFYANPTTNAGLSQLALAQQLDSGGWTVYFTFADDGTLSATAFAGDGSGLVNIDNGSLVNSSITIAGTGVSLGGSISLDAITGLGSTGIVKRTGTNTLAIATAGTDYLTSNQTITLSGDVSGSGSTSITTTIGALKVTNGMLAGSIAASKLVGTDIATVGTITTGAWGATTIAVDKGGTGQTSYTDGQLLIGNTTGNTLTKATLTATANQTTITNGGGSITIGAATHLRAAAALGLYNSCV